MIRPGTTTPESGDVAPAIRRRLHSGRLRRSLLLGGACLLVSACAKEPPHPAAMGDMIAVGPYAFNVVRATKTPNPPPPINTFTSQPGKKGIVVFVYWKTLDGMDATRRLVFIEKFLEDQLAITDSSGAKTEAFSAMRRSLMSMQDPGANWRDWVVVFHVPEASRELTLLVENPEPRDGQPRMTAVPLGM